MDIEKLITSLRETDEYIKTIFSEGGCYQFHLFLKSICPTARPMLNRTKDHVITELGGVYFDINGGAEATEVYGEVNVGNGRYRHLTKEDFELVESWSFSKTRMLSLGECKNCEEPIIF